MTNSVIPIPKPPTGPCHQSLTRQPADQQQYAHQQLSYGIQALKPFNLGIRTNPWPSILMARARRASTKARV
ncbi:Methyltransferase [Corchorus olitorius]|uniref:Methyltransferase n=1 Tax=Corchorus olitorius TaxID=93759 RepID=A0A1R3L1K0_9ROSI|nr:Methyltransferase [Corchorus olitorius]